MRNPPHIESLERRALLHGGHEPGTGLLAQYYDNADFTNLKLTRTEAVNFYWDNGSPAPSIGSDTFSVRWTGQIDPPSTGAYTFTARTDDGVRLWVDGKLVIDKFISQGGMVDNVSAPVELEFGRLYDIRMDYFEGWGRAGAKLSWQGPGVARQVIPVTSLYNEPPAPAPDPTPTPPPPSEGPTYQAENAARAGAVVAKNNAGYTGTGFVDYLNNSNDYVEFTVNAPSAGSYALDIRYANGGSAARATDLRVNGAAQSGGLAFNPSGSWTTWKTATKTVQLAAGANKVRLTASGQSGPNLDALTVRSTTQQPPPPATGFTRVNWTTMAPALFPTAEAFNAVLDGKLYVFGGFSGTNGVITGPVAWSEVYDPATNAWRRLADFPRRWSHVGATSDGRYAYFAGAYVGTGTGFQQTFASKEVWRYDPRSDSYSRLPDLPAARGSGGLVLLGRDLHFFGGADIPARADRGEHWVLNLDSGTTWRAAAPMPNPRTHFGAVAVNGKIYAVGGERNHDENLISQNTTQVYDPATDRWTMLAPMPRAVNHIAGSTVVYQGRILVLGGQEHHDESIADCYAYDPVTNQWAALNPLPGRRFSGLAAVIGNDTYFSGGSGLTTTWRGRPVA